MKPDTPLDYAVFHLSPKHSRCELFVSSDGTTEKIASGLLKPFISHLQIAEEQLSSASPSVKLEVGRQRNAETWFTKGTLERFVRFVSTPEVLELVNTFDAEMSQLEAARRIYSQGAGNQVSGGGGSGVTAADDATKKELLRAIDVRLLAVRQDLSTACARAAAAGFNIDSVSELQLFADRFGTHRLNEACGKYLSLSERRPEIIHLWKYEPNDRALRSSYGSDMSIDDDPTSPPSCQEPAMSEQPNPPVSTYPLSRTVSRESSVDMEDCKKPSEAVPEKDRKDENSTPNPLLPVQPSQHTRRLSVQDRINMFENKQKESSGGKPAVVAKPAEPRRLSSDLSASGGLPEKAVLRRWSGASDMSIDLSVDKKDSESPATVVSQDKKVLNSNDDDIPGVSSASKPEMKLMYPSLGHVSDSGESKAVSFNNSELLSKSNKSSSYLGSSESDGLKHQAVGNTQLRSFINRADDQNCSEDSCKTSDSANNEGAVRFQDPRKVKVSVGEEESSGSHIRIIDHNDQASSITNTRSSVSKGGKQYEMFNQREDLESNEESSKQSQKANQKAAVESGILESEAGSKIKRAFASRYKGNEGVSSTSAQKEVKSVGEIEVAEKKILHMSAKVSTTSMLSIDDSGPQTLKLNRQGLTAELSKKVRVQRDESNFSGNRIRYSSKIVTEAQEGFDSFSTPPLDQVQRTKQSKVNQELNDELKMKANELERLFAEHKLRVPSDQSNSIRKGRSGERETQVDPSSTLQYTKPVPDVAPQSSDIHQSTEPTKNSTKFDVASPLDAINKNFSELRIEEGSRGKSYDQYMQKRDAKLRAEWRSNRAEKEARLKSMQDSLERNKSEMKANLTGSAERHNSVSSARRRAERLRSYGNSKSVIKREQQDLDSVGSEEDEEALDFTEQNHLHGNRALDKNTLFRDIGVHRGRSIYPPTEACHPLPLTPRQHPSQDLSQKNPQILGKRRMQLENNPLAQSVLNFSDSRKENAKPSSGDIKTTRSQVRNYARSKSTNDEAVISRENKPHRSHSLRKSSENPTDFGEISLLDSDGVNLTPIKFDGEVMRSVGTKPFLRKGSRARFVSQASIAKEKASLVSEFVKNEEENNDVESGTDEFASADENDVDEDFEAFNSEDQKIFSNDGETKQGLESVKLVKSGSENGDMATFSHTNQALAFEVPTGESLQDWSEGSPISWNYSHRQNPLTYPHETSDVDASMESPGGSPFSWNSNSFNQLDSDSVRMRKKWGTAQKPMLAAQSSNTNLTRKDIKSGFKRLLKFGRKSRGSDVLVDWISATTSEGDEDTEDGQDPANRSSEDLRKSRMGFSHVQTYEDSYNEEFFNESVQSSQKAIPAPPANFKLREDNMSGSSIKGGFLPQGHFSRYQHFGVKEATQSLDDLFLTVYSWYKCFGCLSKYSSKSFC
ncbi:COP1-interacting family protein [Striga asiatica]|uniref:COP1-interacting family protein n=1 Tax=Striga asiatica TaxID=4170 RepID=A0A5A7QMC7_STRAF|nr:COP1-interacting family protein [Striga asiatica]